MRPSLVEVKLHGKWLPALDLPAFSCLGPVTGMSEGPDGYLTLYGEGGEIARFRPVEWRTLDAD
jgi:hypothetical protein